MNLIQLFRDREKDEPRKPHHCDGCIWGSQAGNKVVCGFYQCVRDRGWSADRDRGKDRQHSVT